MIWGRPDYNRRYHREMLCVTGRPMSRLIRDIYERFGEAHMAEFDWALTPEIRDAIYRKSWRSARCRNLTVP